MKREPAPEPQIEEACHAEPPTKICLDAIEAPPIAEVRLPSGRTLGVAATSRGDQLEVRGLGGEVVMRVIVGNDGPIFTFESAKLELAATGQLVLRGRDVLLAAERDMAVEVGGERHTRVGGADRLEARSVEIQANDDHVGIRARENVRIDAEHVGLNDDPAPAPFPWSKPAEEDR